VSRDPQGSRGPSVLQARWVRKVLRGSQFKSPRSRAATPIALRVAHASRRAPRSPTRAMRLPRNAALCRSAAVNVSASLPTRTTVAPADTSATHACARPASVSE
jgi:hypothetical protein